MAWGKNNVEQPSHTHISFCECPLFYCSLDLLGVNDDDSSVDAVEQVIADDVEPSDDLPEPTPVTPSVSSMSLDNTSNAGTSNPVINDLVPAPVPPRQELVVSPKPEDFSIHNKLGTAAAEQFSGPELSPTSVTNMMEFKDLSSHQAGGSGGIYVDALDWLMDVGVNMLPKSDAEREEDWPTTAQSNSKLTTSQLAQVNSNALSVVGGSDDGF